MQEEIEDQAFIDRLEASWRANAEAAGVETQELEGEITLIKQLMESDAEFFIEFFLADSLDMPVPEFHKEIWGLMQDQEKERILLAVPRDHAKTTLAKLVVVWYWLHTTHRFCVYISNTAPIAKGACRDIMEYLIHPNFLRVYGKIKIVKQSENEGLWIFDLPMGPGRVKRCILRGLGQGQQMRGINVDNQRPDIAVADDVEDNDVVDSKDQQIKLDKWVFGPFIKALARKKKIIWLGNMLAKTSLLARLSRNPRWNPVVFGCLIKDSISGVLKPLWPGKWTAEALQDDFQEYKDNGLVETWMCEMMNMPGHGENGFTAENLHYLPVPTPDDIICSWLTIDPAFGLQAHNDETAIAVHVLPRNGIPMTVETFYGHVDELAMFNEAMRMTRTWGCYTWGIEAVAAQRVLITLFQMMAAQLMLNHKLMFVPLMAGRGDPKIGRIKVFVSLMSNKEWALPDTDFGVTEQILDFDFRKKEQPDDRIDACAYGPAMMNQFLPLIQAVYEGSFDESTQVAQTGLEVCSV